MEVNPNLQIAVLTFALIALMWGGGFLAGYKGTWKHSLVAVATFPALFILFRTIMLLAPYSLPHKTLGLDLIIAWLIGFGSLVGALLGKRDSAKNSLLSHAGMVIGTSAVSIIWEHVVFWIRP